MVRRRDDDWLGVSCELEDLGKSFGRDCGFEMTEGLILTENPPVDIMTKATLVMLQ